MVPNAARRKTENPPEALHVPACAPYRKVMHPNRSGQIAVIFSSTRTDADAPGYAAAAATMETLAQIQAGFCGIKSCRDAYGFGITISYWDSEAAAAAWRDHPDHVAIREKGRAIWYASYTIDITHIERNYDWQRNG